jgi:hypothetical protein
MSPSILRMLAVLVLLANGVAQATLTTYELKFVGTAIGPPGDPWIGKPSTLTGHITTSVTSGPITKPSDITEWSFSDDLMGVFISSHDRLVDPEFGVFPSFFRPGGPPFLSVDGSRLTFDFFDYGAGERTGFGYPPNPFNNFSALTFTSAGSGGPEVSWDARYNSAVYLPSSSVVGHVVPEPSVASLLFVGLALAAGFAVARESIASSPL